MIMRVDSGLSRANSPRAKRALWALGLHDRTLDGPSSFSLTLRKIYVHSIIKEEEIGALFSFLKQS